MKRPLLIALAAFTLTACASSPEPSYIFNAVKIEEQLKLSAKIVAESKQIRARSENALRMASMTDDERRRYRESVEYIPPGLDMAIPMNEHKEAEVVLDMIAKYTGWDFDTRGKRPVNGAIVSINAISTPAFDIVVDIESQVKDRAKVILIENQVGSPKHGVIILDYSPHNI